MAENWLRWHYGTVNDPKWRVVAKRAGQPIHVVIAVWAAMLETASNAVKRGNIDGWNSEDQAAALDLEAAEIDSVYEAMQGKTLAGNRIMKWDERQPKREDNSTDRVRAHRERKAAEDAAGNAEKRDETHGNSRGEERREEKISPSPSLRSGDGAPAADASPDQNASAEDQFWSRAKPMEAIGIRRSALGELAKHLNGDFERGLSTLDDVAAAKKPSTYLGAILRNLRLERSCNSVVQFTGGDKTTPAWVQALRSQGEVVTRDGANWRWSGTLYDDEQAVVGW